MKKVTIMAAIVAAAGLASCTAQAPRADLKTDIDSLSYSVGMARTQGLDTYLRKMGIDSAQIGDFIKGFNEGASRTSKSDAARIIGMQIGQMVSNDWYEQINRQLFAGDSTKTISRDNLLAGFVAGALRDYKTMSLSTANSYMSKKTDEIHTKQLEIKYADNKAAGEKFLAENKNKEGVVTLPSGLQYKVLKKGNGAVPTDSSRVKVHYRGTLIDGKEFDSSYKRKQPSTFRANQVIKGWTEALTMMPVGSKWELYIPQELAYGANDRNRNIPPFSALVFEVELLSIEK